MTPNFISDSVNSKFLKFAHAKFLNGFSPKCVGGMKRSSRIFSSISPPTESVGGSNSGCRGYF